MSNGTRRSVGTVLLGIGLLLILSVAGYFAWSEVQAAQVRGDLEQGAVEAAGRATRMVNEVVQLSLVADDPGSAAKGPAATAQPAGGSSAGIAVTRQPVGRASATVTQRPPATKPPTPVPTATGAAVASASAATITPVPTTPPLLPVRLAIPDLKIDTPVVEMGWTVTQTKNGPVSQWAIPKNAAGHHVNSAGIGQADNLVISGHNNIFGRVFMPISQAWDNDKRVKVDAFTDRSDVLDGREVLLYDASGIEHSYVITDFFRLKDTGVSQKQRETNGRFILPTGDDRVTIITCWPPTNNTHRLVVIARPEK